MSYSLVWFKRDLRWVDHEALSQAAKNGPVRCVYVVEPELWLQSDSALQHFEFIKESLQALDCHLRSLGGCVEIHTGEASEVLSQIWQESPFTKLYSHQETGNAFTYARDLQVAAWCRSNAVVWHEFPQFGVVRGLKNRDLWRSAWERHMSAPFSTPENLTFWKFAPQKAFSMQSPAHLKHNPSRRQRGGRPLGLANLNSFLNARSVGYRGGISSPLSAPDACSRLSAYLAWGCISMREVVQNTRHHLAQLPPQASRQRLGLTAFLSRLYWHCHFIQKLESEPEIEWQNMHRGYDMLRENEFNQRYFDALKAAQTGWPMVDACVTMLRETGWLNFRMRAMLVSVAAYPLWLHWRPVGKWLATQFLDYEPGIHWSQLQMQSGTTGINTTRVYNPIKQAQDHDPHGRFVRRWLPYMRSVPDEYLFEPWKMPSNASKDTAKTQLILTPLTNLAAATRMAKDRVYQRRRDPEVIEGKKAVIDQHASRQVFRKQQRSTALKSSNEKQIGFDF